MIETIHKVVYEAFGFHIVSDIPMPELNRACDQVPRIDISVRVADLVPLWSRCALHDEKIIVNENYVMFQVPETGIFHVQSGNQIQFSPASGCSEDKIRLYLLGTCMGVLLLQRKILPLHGSAIAIDGKAYAIIGDSGAGKSTLSSILISRGHKLLSDDVIAVRFTDSDTPMVTPSYPQRKLWQDSIDKLDLDISVFYPLFDRETKFAVPAQDHFHTLPLPLAGIFELVRTEDAEVRIHRIDGLHRLQALHRHTFRKTFLAPLGLMQWHFLTSANLAGKVDMIRLNRPEKNFTAHELANSMLSIIHKGELA